MNSFCVLLDQEFAFFLFVVDDGEKGPGAFGFTCSCAKHLTGIIDKVITKYACNC